MNSKSNIKKVRFGNRERRSFSKIKEILDIPYLIEVQKRSYESFVKSGIGEVFKDYSPINDYSNKIELHFLEHTLEGVPKYSEKECKDRDATYACPLKVKVRLVTKETGEIAEQEVFMGDFPLMTPNGSFIINGAERVIVSQLVRSPGVYCSKTIDKAGKPVYGATIIPTRGAWLEFQEDSNNVLYVHVDRTRKVTASVLLRSLGYGLDEDILKLFHNDPIMKSTIEKDTSKTEEEGLFELNKRLRPGEIPTVESVQTHLQNMFFDSRRYDLARVGRYKFNKKLSLAARIQGLAAAEGVNPFVKAGEVISADVALKIQNAGINEVAVIAPSGDKFWVIGNNTVDLAAVFPCDPKELGILERVHYPTLVEVLNEAKTKEEKSRLIKANAERLVGKHILRDDIVAAINYILGLHYGVGADDNIDHLGNRRVRSVGELLQNQFRIGIARLERVIKERMQSSEASGVTPQSLINIRPVSSAIKEFFGSSQLSQFMDQSNPIAELTHKRKLSALGPGGLNRERASFDVRDVHYSHYGRMCPVETPEGQNIGLISSLSTYARINEYGFIESPYRKVDKVKKTVTEEIEYLTADDEDKYVVAQANEPLDENDWFVRGRVMMRYQDEIAEIERDEVDYMDVSPRQLVSVATSLIPFLENDDTNRALMGSNMQRQAVPLIRPEAPLIGTGMEHKVAYDSGVMTICRRDGIVDFVSAEEIIVKAANGEKDRYTLQKFERSNQGTCINQRPLVQKGDAVKKGAVLCDGPSTDNGELALGRNILIGFMSWEGYNYEDAILISEKLVREDTFTSIHIEEHEIEARETKLGEEDITRDIPNVGEDALKDLDENGIIRVGAEVRSGDILVGKVTPKGETELTPEERLLRAIFGEKAREVRDTSLHVPHGEGGIVVDVKIFTREHKDELSPGVNKLVRVYIAQKRKLSIGDKMAGRHGNKGVISRILPEADMPFMADGTPLQIVLNPLGVPSRMNIGQVLEVHLGLVAKMLGWHIATPVFDGANEQDIKGLLRENGFINIVKGADGKDEEKVDGKIEMFDGRTGEPFENRVTVGYMYMLKLVHLVDDKIHARSTGPYSLVTQQPLGGKAQFGGQRFGEMEVWALYAYGAANILQEIMTVKSDDIVGRVKTYESIVKGLNISEPGVPESFKVLIKELQSLALDVKVLTENKEEIGLKDLIDDGRDFIDPIFREDKRAALPDFDTFDIAKPSAAKDAVAEDDTTEADKKSGLFEDDDEFNFGDAFNELLVEDEEEDK
jgi:DNA-directed RNA polymerase subunit beta